MDGRMRSEEEASGQDSSPADSQAASGWSRLTAQSTRNDGASLHLQCTVALSSVPEASGVGFRQRRSVTEAENQRL